MDPEFLNNILTNVHDPNTQELLKLIVTQQQQILDNQKQIIEQSQKKSPDRSSEVKPLKDQLGRVSFNEKAYNEPVIQAGNSSIPFSEPTDYPVFEQRRISIDVVTVNQQEITEDQQSLATSMALNVENVPPFQLADSMIQDFEKVQAMRERIINVYADRLNNQKPLLDQDVEENFDSLSDLCKMLQDLHRLYPNGCTSLELMDYENDLKIGRQSKPNFPSTLPPIVSLVELELLIISEGYIYVSPQCLNYDLFHLRMNLCSNLYRFLKKRQKAISLDAILTEMKPLQPEGVPLYKECLIYLCNKYPMIFQLEFDADFYDIGMAKMRLTSCISSPKLNWRVVLDCEPLGADNKVTYGDMDEPPNEVVEPQCGCSVCYTQ